MAQFGHTAQACFRCRADYNGQPPCDDTGICERYTKLHIEDETFPIVELPVVREIIRLWERATVTSPVQVIEEQVKQGDKLMRKRKFIPSLANLGDWVGEFDFERWGLDRATVMDWVALFHSAYVNELKGK